MDIENLKAAYSFINPLNGKITSRFGIRTSENLNVDGYHTGLDIFVYLRNFCFGNMNTFCED